MSRPHTKESFLKKINIKKTGCWHFTGSISGCGYGHVQYYGKQLNAHRLAWILTNGKIKKGLFVCHKCDNRLCVNPDHLFLGTQKDNVLDMVSKGRHHNPRKTHCINGHSFEEYGVSYSSGARRCRICDKERSIARGKKLK